MVAALQRSGVRHGERDGHFEAKSPGNASSHGDCELRVNSGGSNAEGHRGRAETAPAAAVPCELGRSDPELLVTPVRPSRTAKTTRRVKRAKESTVVESPAPSPVYDSWQLLSNRIEQLGLQIAQRVDTLQHSIDTELPARIRDILSNGVDVHESCAYGQVPPDAKLVMLTNIHECAIKPRIIGCPVGKKAPHLESAASLVHINEKVSGHGGLTPKAKTKEKLHKAGTGNTTLEPPSVDRSKIQWQGSGATALNFSDGELASAGGGRDTVVRNIQPTSRKKRSTIMQFLLGDPDQNSLLYDSDPKEKEVLQEMNQHFTGWKRGAAAIATNTDRVMCVVLALNALVIGFETNHFAEAGNLDSCSTPALLKVLEALFFFTYAAELGVRFSLEGLAIYKVKEWRWNVFNTGLLVAQVFEFMLGLADMVSDCRISDWGDEAFYFDTLGFMRFLRLLRLARLARFNMQLRMIIQSILQALQAAFWTAVLLFTVIYVVAVYFTIVARFYRQSHVHGKMTADLQNYYGSVEESFVNLFQAITGGVDWDALYRPLVGNSTIQGVVLLGYMVFMVLILLNLVTGIFVEAVVTRTQLQKERNSIHRLTSLFRMIDEDQDGCLSWPELEAHLADKEFQQAFETIGIDITDANILFRLLDKDNDGSLDPKEFLNGCLRLRLPTKAMDLAILLRELLMPEPTTKSHRHARYE